MKLWWLLIPTLLAPALIWGAGSWRSNSTAIAASPNSGDSTVTEDENVLDENVQDENVRSQQIVRRLEARRYQHYYEVIERTKTMVSNPEAIGMASELGLSILNVTWEDTGRFYGSAVGPNISDMTIQVQQRNPNTGQQELHLMPVIRNPNFSDLTADIPIDQFYLLVGNEKGDDLEKVSLKDFLADMRRYLTNPDSWEGRRSSLLADRDTHVLVSAQACFLPIPQGDSAQFNPVLFNYQSYAGNPAVLTILATREGTSVTIIDNQRDGFDAGRTWGQRLFFNHNGERASLTGQRLSDFQAESSATNSGNPDTTPNAAGEEGLNMVMLIQVPLKQKAPPFQDALSEAAPYDLGTIAPAAPAMQRSDVEAAVIGHGEVEGPFTEIDGLEIERDPDFPIRVTVQFYKATSNGVVSDQDMTDIYAQIQRVYADGDYVGSLVVDGASDRPTEYNGSKDEPEDWWDQFWQHAQNHLNLSREEAWEIWLRMRGNPPQPQPEEENS